MIGWQAQRDSCEGEGFSASRDALDIPVEAWDQFAPAIDEVLCGADVDALDQEYPPDANGVRVLQSNGSVALGIPPMYIAFALDERGIIEYISVRRV